MLVFANGVFAGAELALISIRKTRLQELIDQGSTAARSVQALRDNPERFLATVQIGITVVGSTAAAFGGASIAQRLSPPLQELGLPPERAETIAFALVVGLVSYLSLVLGELVPKSLALRYSESYALLIGPPLRGLSRLMKPVVWLLTFSSNLVLRFFGDKTSFTESRLSPEELQQLVEEAARSGGLHPRSGEIASRAFDLADLVVTDMMVPRTRVVAIRRHSTPEDVRRVLLEEGHSRMPVFEDSVDHIIGYVVAKDLLSFALEQQLILLEDVLRPAYFVPETMRALDALQQMQARRIQLAIVVDEQGGLAGLVTMKDLVEELVGTIASEHETPHDSIHHESNDTVVVDALLPIRELNRALDTVELPEGDTWTTVGGLCTSMAGSIPTSGARFTLTDGTVLEVTEASARRVKQVRIHLPPRASTPPPPSRD
ncbi:hemolysin family protein [Archangium primigenium]|uniref:hemolysin family protein n=1 Tax=[Archangium] primigenium TaxID=2792470 RepID=UPI00195A3468|nr:hemolysin family protein [Archangium primigenium]MBM7114664.1 HlyC/CorC family transporter [Archangium primigenium]